MTTTSITARFGGRDMTFCIPRTCLSGFEKNYGPGITLARRLARGEWTVEDVRNVLEFAARPASQLARVNDAPPGLADAVLPAADTHIAETLAARPPAIYAQLALLILTASLMGLDDESDAIFTDEPADGEG